MTLTLMIAPMLATAKKRVDHIPEGWIAEPKLDGWRAIVVITAGKVKVYSRRGNDLTPVLPELQPLASVVGDRTVLDGELIAGEGRASDFYALSGRLRSKSPATRERYVGVNIGLRVFDVLTIAGENLCRSPWSERRAVLEEQNLAAPAWSTVPVLDGELADMLAACAQLDIEGVVLKRRASFYLPGERSKDWVKVKTQPWGDYHATRRHEH